MSKYLLLLYLCFAIIATFNADPGLLPGEKLLLLQEVTRHGIRFPTRNVFNETIDYAERLGELTGTGLRQKYIQGKTLKSIYSDFFNRFFYPNEILVTSTSVDRAMMSAMAELQGIFDGFETGLKEPFKFDDEKLRPDLTLAYTKFDPADTNFDHPLPNKYVPYTLRPSNFMQTDRICNNDYYINLKNKAWVYINNKVKDSQFYKDSIKMIGERFNVTDKIGDYSHNPRYDMTYAERLADFFIMKYSTENTDFDPKNSKSDRELFKRMMTMYELSLVSWTIYDKEVNRIAVSPGLSFIGRNIIEKAKNLVDLSFVINDDRFSYDENVKNSELKYALQSGHDAQILQTLNGIDLYDSQCKLDMILNYDGTFDEKKYDSCSNFPKTAAVVLFELVQKQNDDLVVRINYNGQYLNVCQQKSTDSINDKYDCDLPTFFEVLRSKILHTDEFDSKCLVSPKKDTVLRTNTLKGEHLYQLESVTKTELGATILILQLLLGILILTVIFLLIKVFSQKKQLNKQKLLDSSLILKNSTDLLLNE